VGRGKRADFYLEVKKRRGIYNRSNLPFSFKPKTTMNKETPKRFAQTTDDRMINRLI
jgi:hypothetical protein